MPDPIVSNNVLNAHQHLFEKDFAKVPDKEPFKSQPLSQIPLDRYNYVFYGADNEELYARAQSGWDQLANGIGKAVGTFASSFITGTVGVINGVGQMVSTEKASSFYNNEFNRTFDDFNKYLEDALPNYYTHAEKDAEWYSPTNIFSANFLGDKVLKNLGYSAGAIVGGMGWGAALKGIGLTSRLVRAGKGLQALEATEAVMANTPRLQQLGAINKTLTSLWNSTKGLAGTALTNTDRAIVSAMGMMGEASIEAMGASNNFRNKLIEDYKSVYGVAPTGETLEEINSYADKVGNNIFAANAALLTFTNYVQLPKILGSSKTLEKRAINSIEKEVAEGATEGVGKWVAGTPTTGNILSPVVNKLGKPGRFIDKYILGPGRLAVSAGEAFEEGAQFSIETGVEDYFNRAYKHEGDAEELLGGVGDVLGNIFSEGVRKTLTSKEGMESILIGGVSGGLQKIKSNIKERGFFGTGGEIGRNTQLAVDALNKTNIQQILQDGKKYAGIAIGSQQLRQQAIENNDTLNEKDYEEDYTLSYIMPRVKYGKEESIYQEIKDYREQAMSDSGFEELQASGVVLPGETKERFVQRLNTIEKSAQEVKKVYDHVNDKYSGLVDKEGKVMYTPEVVDKMVYAASKVTDYDQRLKELETKLLNNNIDSNPIKEKLSASKEFKEKPEEALKDTDVKDEVNKTIASIQASDSLENDDVQKDFEDFTEMLVRRQQYINDYFNLKNSPEKFIEKETKPFAETTTSADGKTNIIKIKTKSGERDITIGEEYFLGRVVEQDKDGNEVYRFPKLTVLGENEDGTIKIKDSNGKVRDVSKDVLLDYKLGKVSSVEGNKTAKYYLAHINDIYQYNFGKDFGGKRRGRLEYDPYENKLYFVYKNANGERKSKEIDNSHFVAQEGFNDARIKIVGRVKAETVEQKQAREEFTSPEELANQKSKVDEKLSARRRLIETVRNETKKRLDRVNKKILSKREELEKINSEISELAEFRKKDKYSNVSVVGNIKKIISRSIQGLSKLTNLKVSLENEIAELENVKEELEIDISYFDDFILNLAEFPEYATDIVKELKEQVGALEDLSVSIGKDINSFSKMIDGINDTIKDLAKWLRDSINKFDSEYSDDIKEKIQTILNSKNVNYEDIRSLKEAISDYGFIQDLNKEISINKDQLDNLTSKIEELYKKLDDIGKEQRVKEAIIKVFDTAIAKEMERRADEQKVARNETLFNQVLGTMNLSVQNRQYDREYEEDPKKSDRNVLRATTFPTERSTGGDALEEHHLRANRFGNRMESLPAEKRKNIRGVLVTQKNQAKLIPGLVEFLAGGKAGIGPSTIAMVVVEKGADGVIRPVDEFGNPIPGKGENETDEAFAARMQASGVFQVMPENIEGMFRATTNTDTKSALMAQYKEWRTQILNNPSEYAYNIQASFGIPQLVKKTDDKGNTENDYSARVAVEDSGLISESDLRVAPVIEVPTSQNTITQGSTSFTNALGRVFLKLKNGFVPLRNRKHTSREAETIFKVLYKLSENLTRDGKLMGVEESERLISWLRTVVYWGTPTDRATGEFKDPGYNSVWFDKEGDVFKLFMSGKLIDGKPVGISQFTPSELLSKKSEITSLLGEMYTNTNSFKVQSGWELPYEQITDVTEDGVIESVRWPNYQSYLLSNKAPNKEGKLTVQRSNEDIPLTTSIRPLRDENDTNRNGVYFIINDRANDDRFSSIVPVATQPKTLTPGAPKPAPQPTAPSVAPVPPAKPVGKFVLDGKTVNSLPMSKPAKATIKFTYNENVPDEVNDLEIVPEKGETVQLTDALITALNLVDKVEGDVTVTAQEQAINLVVNHVLREVNKEIAAAEEFEKQQAAPPAPTAPVSDAQARKNKAVASITKVTDGWRAVADDEGGASADELFGDTKEEVLKLIDDKYKDELSPVSTDVKAEAERRRQEINNNRNRNKEQKNAGAPVLDGYSNAWFAYYTPEGEANRVSFKTQKEALAWIDSKYDAELAALEGAKPAEVTTAPQVAPTNLEDEMTEEERRLMEEQSNNTPEDPEYRVVVENQIKQAEREDWNKVEAFIKKNLPMVPFYRVKNVIQAVGGRKAWGMLKNGALYVYQNAEVGTAYHEVFEAVWKMFADVKEQESVIKEFRARKGSFIDRPTGTSVKYSQATPQQIKEQLAEEFRDYVQYGKVPAKPVDGRPFIVKLFADIITFIKNFFIGSKAQSNTERLFEKISTGYYANQKVDNSALSYAEKGIIDIDEAFASEDDDLREIVGFTSDQVHDMMQHLTYMTLVNIARDNQSLFNIMNEPKDQLYVKLKSDLQTTVLKDKKAAEELYNQKKISEQERNERVAESTKMWMRVTRKWEEIKARHEEYLRTYGIEFDENDETNVKEDRTGKGEYDSANKVDNFRKTNSAIKLLLASLPIVDNQGKFIYSGIGGVKLMSLGETYVSVMNRVHNASTIDEKLAILKQMAEEDTNYERLYRRLTKQGSDAVVNYDLLDKHDLQLLSTFNTTFSKQNPDVKILNILASGDIQVMDSNLSTAARQVKEQFVNGMKAIFRNPQNRYFEKDKKGKALVAREGAVKSVELSDDASRVSFLNSIGIEGFTEDEIRNLEATNPVSAERFRKAVAGIRLSMMEKKKIATIGGKILDIEGNLLKLAEIRAKIDNPEFSSTFYGIGGERLQTFIGENPSSAIYNVLSSLDNLYQLKTDPRYVQYRYLLTDAFAGKNGHSVLLNAMFDFQTGRKRADFEQYMKPAIADGTNNQPKGKKKESSKLNFRERLTQEMNMNLQGFYYNLVAGDASLEYMTYMGNHVSEETLKTGYDQVYSIFRGYLIDEIELSRDDSRPVALKGGRKRNDLRFFKTILKSDEKLYNDIIEDGRSGEEIYDEYSERINKAVLAFINEQTAKTKTTLSTFGLLTKNEDNTNNISSIKFPSSEAISDENLNRHMNTMTINFAIANIEYHKLLYSDPYQYEDELKRIKNFLSPRQTIVNSSPLMNAAYNKIWNEGFSEEDAGYTNFNREYFKTAVYSDVLGTLDLPGYEKALYKETDGGGVIHQKAHRNLRIRMGQWNDNEESQYRYDMVWMKKDKGGKLTPKEQQIYDRGNPGVQSAYTPVKPIVSGNKADGNSYNDVVLDKFALYPLSYRIAKTIAENGGNSSINAMKLYDKMLKDDVDYVLFNTSRKVGAKESNLIYNPEDGSFNESPYKGITNIPFSIVSIQSEVPTKDTDDTSRGTQVTKLLTMDFMEAGVPVDFVDSDGKTTFSAKRYKEWYDIKDDKEREKQSPLYKEIKNNETLLREITKEGYKTLLEKLGIQEVNGKYSVSDFSKAAKTLRDEMMKREVNDNIIDALDDLEQGKVLIEATPAYQQIRNILYSIVDKNVISPKINGGMKVQIPSTFFETNRIAPKKINGKDAFTSDVLKFYTNKKGERVCEIMVSRWFGGTMSDKEALEYLNSPEGQKEILSGLGFRIPTQKQNSIDSFVIKQFLPKEMKDSVVVPAALVQKAGSDFDIDKLTAYLKNVYIDIDGKPKMIPFLGFGEVAKKKLSEMYDNGDFVSIEQLKGLSADKRQELDRVLEEEESALTDTASGKLMFDLFGASLEKDIIKEFIAKGARAEFKRKFIDNLYKKSLQNAYIQSSQNLVSSEENFNRLIAPNSADQLKELSNKISEKTTGAAFDYADPGNMLSRGFMSRLRHAFVTGKYAIGIAAIAQTNHSLNQRQPIYIDSDRVGNLTDEDFYWLSGGTMNKNDIDIKFGQHNRIEMNGKMVPTLSMIRNAERSDKYPNGQDISDLIGQFIDGYVDIAKGPWIMELGATPNVAGTWLFLVKVGVPIDTVAYFMNQPIIRDYLRSVENSGYSYLFIEDFVDNIKKSSKYNVGKEQLEKVKVIPGTGNLEKMVGVTSLTPQQKAEQQFILNEFLKYAKMAEQLRLVTQGTNYDTANLNDPYLLFKKESDYAKAKQTIISSASDVLNNSFVEDIREYGNKSRNAVAQILKSDQSVMRNIMEKVLTPYANLSDKDFVNVARKAVSDFFDWVMQNNSDVPKVNFLKRLMLDENSGVKMVKDFKDGIARDKNHPMYNNIIIGKKGILNAEISDRLGATPDNLMLTNKDNKVYDQNLIIEGFRELREYLKSSGRNDVYQNIVGVSLLQSGLSTSKISFTSLLPYEDFVKQYNDTLSMMESLGKVRLMDFYDLNVFERNNWSDDDIVPHESAPPPKRNAFGGTTYNTKMKFDKGSTKNVQKAINEGKIPNLLRLNARSRAADSEFVVYSWEVMDASILTEDEIKAGMSIVAKKRQMKSEGDFSFIKKGLFKKVYYPMDETPVTTSFSTQDGKIVTQFVYKMINAWGDSFRAKELYSLAVPSKIDNGFVKVEEKEYKEEYVIDGVKYTTDKKSSSEKSDEVVASYFPRGVVKQAPAAASVAPTQPSTSVEKIQPEGKPEIDITNENNCG